MKKSASFPLESGEFIKNEALLDKAMKCWESLSKFREERERCKRFTYGDQWQDFVYDRGVRMCEEDYIRSQGNLPLKNNLIRRLVRNVMGVFRNQWHLPQCVARDPAEASRAATINLLLEYNMELNRLEEIYARTMEEYLISGMAVHKKWFGLRGATSECVTDIVSPDRFFFDTSSRDFRGSDITMTGEIHHLDFESLFAAFARTPAWVKALEGLCGARLFNSADDGAVFTVVEIWQKKPEKALRCLDRSSGRLFEVPFSMHEKLAGDHGGNLRIEILTVERWHYHFLLSTGEVLASGVSPYNHGSHPYVFKAYPYIDGEIHSFVSDIIDQQKLTNRLISMYDWILRASAKGVLLFPEGSLPDGVDINDIADEWSRFNGVIVYRPRPGVALPQQVSSKSADIGITQLLEIQMKMMEDISGVNGALQGKLDNGSISGTLYDQQTRNSLTALADLLKSFEDFIRCGAMMEADNIRQFFSRRKIEAIVGERSGCSLDLKPTLRFRRSASDFKFV